MKNLNLGCGTWINKEEGWVNTDIFDLEDEKYIKADARDLPFESDSIDYIICDQVLEHIPMADVSTVLYNIRRVLKVGGRCVIIVPDFAEAARQWLSVDFNGGFDPVVYNFFSEVIYGNQQHPGEEHRTPMCAGYLNYMLNMVGLTEHTIAFYPTFGDLPDFPGVRPSNKGSKLRNAQLVVDITKT